MSDNTPTGKIVARKDESDTTKIDVSMLAKAWRMAKDNPIVLVLVAVLSGGSVGVGGGQTTIQEIIQQAQWWQIAFSIIGFGVLNWMSGVSKTLTKILARLERGDERMTNTELDVHELKRAHQADLQSRASALSTAQAARNNRTRGKAGSEGSLSAHGT